MLKLELAEMDATGALSEDGLKHFKTYKYSSVDKSPISYYILRHYVRIPTHPPETSH